MSRDSEALARNTDPETSHEAAHSMDDAVTRLEKVVTLAIRASGDRGATWDELAALTGIDKASISPRFKPLRRKGQICSRTVEGEIVKRAGNSGRGQIVWFAK